MAEIPSGLISHARKVCSLYKRALRALEISNRTRHEYRYRAVLLRQRFDKNRNIPDVRVAKRLLLAGEEELYRMNQCDKTIFPNSPGGICYERYFDPSDAVLDYWHPIDKARYPKYFAQREKLKEEYQKFYKKLYPESSEEANKSNK
ncbi:NADH dehydrogenase [ubiquinone] 1 beta subcomplex subunit 9 [Eufriesea mexicana]|uniref:NADH dehydrogenase [ubiquinone] 1 beta subcomplex subunit 9 n=1 Tax=Eufriesea mexicana TaxID=516756 RepID=UPI00083BFC84|nr:PREDICTED: NADH dehydrogenase [ubiquinone] 1 beta subcomplex subunit 9 [Eufriesea mexicana]OAD56609.1 NADH dehydrogenase [ubiquinone] 1 beta subcomplex subunit 9 [Eufriesea mexicana]